MLNESLPQLRFDIGEVARILRISRATLYQRIRIGAIAVQKDGKRTFVTAEELHRYVTPKREQQLTSR
jgi:excisionase family DNA binding protein